ncbi:MAG: hypothetical protein U0M12_02025 [Acutalibacteraceae bacterium]|nr:hypothetical protein [Acutalibacteraceae bacterium]
MGNLYTVMDELLKVEYELNAFKDISTVLYNGCRSDNENAELKAILCVTVKYINSLSSDLRHSISSLDEFIANNPNFKINSTNVASTCTADC